MQRNALKDVLSAFAEVQYVEYDNITSAGKALVRMKDAETLKLHLDHILAGKIKLGEEEVQLTATILSGV